jgi:alanyl-tRNA synthetase
VSITQQLGFIEYNSPILNIPGARMTKTLTGAEIRQTFIDFFVEHKHTIVPSAPLVPGGDSTLLFTNAGMVQFKDVFLGTDKRPYTRAVNSQKCLRVAGKHNDLDEVGRDDFHHTFFEMLGNWSFGDYYKQDAIAWAWQLLTDVWKLPKDKLYATCFKDDRGNIPTDDEAADIWKRQLGFDGSHLLFFGRKENFWEMAETGPCGPCSEIHIDLGEDYDNLAGKPHRCGVNGECERYLELWNNVFIQYNRTGPDSLEPLPATHVDTGMGFERIVSVLQGVDSNYKIDLFQGVLNTLLALTGDSQSQMFSNFTPYRVIADHSRAAAFLIADGVVPGNIGRNYICRMIIRRAARFGTKLGLHEPFLAKSADAVIAAYSDFYPELLKHRASILDNITREEIRFARTVESGTAVLMGYLDELKNSEIKVLNGGKAFDLYATYGLPFEIARDIAREQDMDVDENGFRDAMDEHRLASGGGKAMGKMDGADAELYSRIIHDLQVSGQIGHDGVEINVYDWTKIDTTLLALVMDGQLSETASAGDRVEVLTGKTGFYTESGGQVSDSGIIRAMDDTWEIEIDEMRKPAAGATVHVGEVIFGHPRIGDKVLCLVDLQRRHDIMRNHTATHLLHAALHKTVGEMARQAGSLVAPDRLRFDFTHPEALTTEQIEKVEKLVNEAIASDMPILPKLKSHDEAIAEGAMALFGEKYGDTVRTITITAEDDEYREISRTGAFTTRPYSYELCGGTHLDRTSDIGVFLILSEGSAAAGIRRIEAVTGRGAYALIAHRFKIQKQIAALLKTSIDDVSDRLNAQLDELASVRKDSASLKNELALVKFTDRLKDTKTIKGVRVFTTILPGIDKETLSVLADRFREKHSTSGVCVVGTVNDNQCLVMAAVTKDLEMRGVKAGELVGYISRQLGAGGGGAPHLAFGGGKDVDKLPEAIQSVSGWLESKLQ